MPVNRRRQRSTRVLVAVALLVAAGALVLTSLLVGPVELLAVAGVVGYLAGVGAARIVANELARTRRDAARDRARQAQSYQEMYVARVTEHTAFASEMTRRVIDRDAQIRELRATLRLAERRGSDAVLRLRRESKRSAALQTKVAELYAELDRRSEAIAEAVRQAAAADESVAVWDGEDAPTVVDLMAWEAGLTAAMESQRDDSTSDTA